MNSTQTQKSTEITRITMWDRAKQALNTRTYKNVCNPVLFKQQTLNPPPNRQYVLRMMLQAPETQTLQIPKQLNWLKPLIIECQKNQHKHGIYHPFVYVTVRHGTVTSTTDDLWHVDGFSTRITHLPEQNYLWSTNPTTEILRQGFHIPKEFNPLKHNIHQFFQDREYQPIPTYNGRPVYNLKPETVYIIDPYVIHRRPAVTKVTKRTFVRISFVPIEIRDDSCTQNPLLKPRQYNQTDFRCQLARFNTKPHTNPKIAGN